MDRLELAITRAFIRGLFESKDEGYEICEEYIKHYELTNVGWTVQGHYGSIHNTLDTPLYVVFYDNEIQSIMSREALMQDMFIDIPFMCKVYRDCYESISENVVNLERL